MKTILYVTDFSPNAETALAYAHELSRKTGANLVAFHVYDNQTLMNSPISGGTFEEIQSGLKKMNLDKLRSTFEMHCGVEASKNIQYEVREDTSTVHGILRMIETLQADLVVMGTKGMSKIRELLVGSTSVGVIQKASCPVLAVPPNATFRGLETIVYAADLETKDIEAIEALTEIGRLFDAKITVIHIVDKFEYVDKEVIEKFKELLTGIDYPQLTFEMKLADDIYQQLNREVTTKQATLIAMLEHRKRTLLDKWFRYDLVKRMDLHTNIALLSFNENALERISDIKHAQIVKN